MHLNVQLIVFVVVWLVGDVVAPSGGGKKKPGPPPKVVYNGVSTADISSWGEMINGMKKGDWCADGKVTASVATSYCEQVIRLLDRLPPYMRKPECRHVTAGACRKISGLNECTLKTYSYKKWGKLTVGWKTNSETLRFKDCVGKVEWDEARHQQWLKTRAISP